MPHPAASPTVSSSGRLYLSNTIRVETEFDSIILVPLNPADREQFILDNQEAFNYGALEEFGRRDDHFEEDGKIISRETIENSIDGGEAYRIMQDGNPATTGCRK